MPTPKTTMADAYEWHETHGDGAENRPPPGDDWEYMGPGASSSELVRVSRWRRRVGCTGALRGSVTALVDKWVEELRGYPASSEGRYAAHAVAACIKDLRDLLKDTK